MLLKDRLKILLKIAQTTGTSNNTITKPPVFDPISGPWTFISQSYNAATVGYIRYILGIINVVMHYATNGQYNLLKNQSNLGSIDVSILSSDGKNIVLLAKLFYNTFLNVGKPFMLGLPSSQQISAWIHMISQSQALANLSQIGQTGTLAQQLNASFSLDGSFKQNIINYLNYIEKVNIK